MDPDQPHGVSEVLQMLTIAGAGLLVSTAEKCALLEENWGLCSSRSISHIRAMFGHVSSRLAGPT